LRLVDEANAITRYSRRREERSITREPDAVIAEALGDTSTVDIGALITSAEANPGQVS